MSRLSSALPFFASMSDVRENPRPSSVRRSSLFISVRKKKKPEHDYGKHSSPENFLALPWKDQITCRLPFLGLKKLSDMCVCVRAWQCMCELMRFYVVV